MESLKGKRLLVIGCGNNWNDIQTYAKREGVVIVTAGTWVDQRMKNIASEVYENVNVLEMDVALAFFKEKNIDGLFVGGSEDVISKLIDIAAAANLPFYSSRELWDRLMNKQSFKDTCRAYNVPTPIDYIVREEHLDEDASKLPYPVVIKPVDSCGANGVMKCDRKEDFIETYKFSKSKSKSGQVTVESFIDGENIGVYYTFVDGRVSLSSMHDKYIRKVPGSFIPLSEIYAYPSKYLSQYLKETDQNVRNMLEGLGIKNGITSVQGFYDHGTFRFIEIGFRLGGTAQYRYTKAINDFSSFDMMMTFGLTGKMDGYDQSRDNASFNKPCCTLSLLSKGGTIARVEGLDEIKSLPEILTFEERYKVGDTIMQTRTISQFHYRFFLIADSVDRMKEVINMIQTTVQAYDTEGEAMLITKFDTNKLDFGDNKFEQ